MHYPNRLLIDRSALQANWRWLAATAGVRCGAAVKANGYGLGAVEVVDALLEAGCRDFYVSSWVEAQALGSVPPGARLSVLHGFAEADVEYVLSAQARPVLNSAQQVQRWKELASGKSCDVMIDTGINRLGLALDEIACLEGLRIDTLMSHLACADEDHPLNREQLQRFRALAGSVAAGRYSLANSAGILLGKDYAFSLVRPGLAIYGGIPRNEAAGKLQQVFKVEADVLQRRRLTPGESCGYGATFTATEPTEVALVNIGYADGYMRGFSARGAALADGVSLPVLGIVSMDMVAVRCDAMPQLAEGDTVELQYDLPSAAAQSGLTQYELLTSLGRRFERRWV